MNSEKGLCQCGCGQKTRISKDTHKKRGHIKGEPYRFLPGHNKKGENNPRWNGGKTKNPKGIVSVLMPEHPRASHGYVYEHILVAEKALGKPLPAGAVVHHANGTKAGPLVICQDDTYHKLLHRRMRAFRACGHTNWRKCPYCKQYSDPIDMVEHGDGHGGFHHRICRNMNQKKRKK